MACRISDMTVDLFESLARRDVKPGPGRSLEHPSEKSLKRSAAASSQPSGKQSWEIAKVDCLGLRFVRSPAKSRSFPGP